MCTKVVFLVRRKEYIKESTVVVEPRKNNKDNLKASIKTEIIKIVNETAVKELPPESVKIKKELIKEEIVEKERILT